jgi:energy-coupling factor transporter ATP-binding protein EcfA2
MTRVPPIGRFTVITGHYGCGKTNLAINLALDLASEHGEVMLVDLDIVNPYFRSSDYTAMLERHGIRVISPTFAGTTLETPSLSAAVNAAFECAGHVIFDVGGDDAGATALGRYSKEIAAIDYELLYVINRNRNLTATPAEAVALLAEIEHASHLKATGVVNNTHLRDETTLETVLGSLPYARETAALLGLPLVFTTVPEGLAGEFSPQSGAASYVENAYPVTIHVRTPWEDVADGHKEAR